MRERDEASDKSRQRKHAAGDHSACSTGSWDDEGKRGCREAQRIFLENQRLAERRAVADLLTANGYDARELMDDYDEAMAAEVAPGPFNRARARVIVLKDYRLQL
jgi:uncharacterized membrane protein